MNLLTCIIVDDEPLALKRLEKELSRLNEMKVIGSYNNPLTALTHILREQPDIAFLDIEMPGMDGFEMEARMLSAECKTQIVFVTGNLLAINTLRMRKNVDLLVKPVNPEDLQSFLGRNKSTS